MKMGKLEGGKQLADGLGGHDGQKRKRTPIYGKGRS